MNRDLDPISLQVMRHTFQSIAEEMGAALIRTALSTNIKDRRDCSTALYTPSGDLVAQAEHIPLHLGLMVSVVKKVLSVIPVENMEPGDAIITNDPYVSGSHLPDVCMLSPVFLEGRCLAILANLAHHVDLGGMVPGSMPTTSSEIFQEGLRIPPLKLVERGRPDRKVTALIANNVRTPYETSGDFLAQMAANNVGRERFCEVVSRQGPDRVAHAMDAIIRYAERRMRSSIAEIPTGTVTFEDALEGDGLSDESIPIRTTLQVQGDTMRVDFTGTAPQARGSVNATRAVTLACVYFAVKSVVDPGLPSCEGACRPLDVITPPGSLVNPRFPAPVSNANINTAQRITDVVLGALAQLVPQRVPAASTGSMTNFTVGGLDPRTGAYYSHVETYGGGQGALHDLDGMDGVHTNMTNTRNAPVEVMETACPLRVERYSLVPDSGGAGRHRGGTGILRDITILAEDTTFTLGMERRRARPWGLCGGGPGGPSDSYLVHPDGARERLPTKVTRTVPAGTRIVFSSAGGGGYGPPGDRDTTKQQGDIREGLVTAQAAAREYGHGSNDDDAN